MPGPLAFMKAVDVKNALILLWSYLSVSKKQQAIRALLLLVAGRKRLTTAIKQKEKTCENLQVGRHVMMT